MHSSDFMPHDAEQGSAPENAWQKRQRRSASSITRFATRLRAAALLGMGVVLAIVLATAARADDDSSTYAGYVSMPIEMPAGQETPALWLEVEGQQVEIHPVRGTVGVLTLRYQGSLNAPQQHIDTCPDRRRGVRIKLTGLDVGTLVQGSLETNDGTWEAAVRVTDRVKGAASVRLC